MNLIMFDTSNAAGAALWDEVFCCAFFILMAAILLYARAVPQGDKRWWMLTGLSGLSVIAGMLAGEGWGRVLLLDAAAFLAVGLVWIQDSPDAKRTARSYLIFLSIAVVFLAAGLFLAGEGDVEPAFPNNKLAAGLLIVGFCLKLALVPFYFWLPEVAEHAKPMTTALIVSVIDIAAFSELIHLRSTAPWLFTGYTSLWLAVVLLSMFGGALLALAQTNIKRMLAFSTIDDMGYLVFGLLAGTRFGIHGAVLAAISHAFFKVLLFAAVGVVENRNGHDLTLEDRGMAAQNPVSAAVFILSALGMIGVPPFFGFIGRWRLYLSGVEYGGVAMVLVMATATALALLYYVRVIHRVWLGKPQEQVVSAKEPALAATVMIALIVLLLACGLFPGWLTGLTG